jgi:hypothetical protein
VPIKLTSPSIFSALEGAANGTITPKNSENFAERMARVCSLVLYPLHATDLLQYLNAKMTAVEAYVMENPMFMVFMIGLALVVGYLGLRRCLADDSVHDREYGYSKSGRMD